MAQKITASWLPMARVCPSGEKATESIPLWPVRGWPRLAGRTEVGEVPISSTVWSALPVARVWLSGENTICPSLVWPVRGRPSRRGATEVGEVPELDRAVGVAGGQGAPVGGNCTEFT